MATCISTIFQAETGRASRSTSLSTIRRAARMGHPRFPPVHSASPALSRARTLQDRPGSARIGKTLPAAPAPIYCPGTRIVGYFRRLRQISFKKV